MRPEQRGDLRAGLDEAEDVVDEQEHVLALASRKYSAIVRPDSATRMRAPGGSFIWPKTSIVLSMTPDSFISSQRSLPSRERSPTPQNADRPPCSWARLWISSWMSTVLPTPAPPNRPTLPPLA